MDKSKIHILVVDDEPDILEIVSYNLKTEGYVVTTTDNGIKAIELARKINPQLILLDLMMPEMDGIETCEKIRAIPSLNNILISFFTARGEDYSQVAGYEAGADDYITKPIKPKVLVSKIKALLRRLNNNDNSNKNAVGNIVINRDEYLIEKDGKKLFLPKKEFELFSLLASNPGKVFNRDTILNTVWGHDVVVGGRTIDVHIRKLRERIGDDYFSTVKGVGYKFVAKK
ncbi:MAG: response regulator transcription factor [Flavobacteriaceae bacterium]|nr:response regulator transcription factor [Flavobacteriaceae bacterium]